MGQSSLVAINSALFSFENHNDDSEGEPKAG